MYEGKKNVRRKHKSSIIDSRIKNGYKNANVHVDSVAKKRSALYTEMRTFFLYAFGIV